VSSPAEPTPDAAANASPGPEQDAAEMLSVDARKVVLLGTALFFLTFLILLPFWSWLGQHDHRVWLWTALSGAVLGAISLPLIRKHTDEGRLG
jgi:hypothetical protein